MSQAPEDGIQLSSLKGGVDDGAPARSTVRFEEQPSRRWQRPRLGRLRTRKTGAAQMLDPGDVWQVQKSSIKVFCYCWNVGGSEASSDSQVLDEVRAEFKEAGAHLAPIVVVGLQEVCELNMKAITTGAGGGAYREWAAFFTDVLKGFGSYVLLNRGLCEMVGLQLLVFTLPWLCEHITFTAPSQVKCGAAGLAGNKGAVGWRMNVFQTSLCLVNAHLAAGHGSKNAEQRRVDFMTIEGMGFEYRLRDWRVDDHDVVFWMGDTNSRLMVDEQHARAINNFFNEQLAHGSSGIERIIREFDKHDELSSMQKRHKMFKEYSEAKKCFPPTYKLRIGSDGYEAEGETSGGKIRVPGWTDRILWRDRLQRIRPGGYDWVPHVTQSDHRAVRLSADMLVTRISRPQVHRDHLVQLLSSAAFRPGKYPVRAFLIALKRWRLSKNVLSFLILYALPSTFFTCFWLWNQVECSSRRKCVFEKITNKVCTNIMYMVEHNPAKVCKEQVVYSQLLYFHEVTTLQSLLFFQLLATIMFGVVSRVVFQKTIHATGSEVIASHVDRELQREAKLPWPLWLRRALYDSALGFCNAVGFYLISVALFFMWLTLGLKLSVIIWGEVRRIPPHEFPPESCQCYVSVSRLGDKSIQNDWNFRRKWSFWFAFFPWMLVQGFLYGLFPFLSLTRFFGVAGTLCEQVKAFWKGAWTLMQFGLVAFSLHLCPIINILAPMSNTVAMALWAVEVERLLETPATHGSAITSVNDRTRKTLRAIHNHGLLGSSDDEVQLEPQSRAPASASNEGIEISPRTSAPSSQRSSHRSQWGSPASVPSVPSVPLYSPWGSTKTCPGSPSITSARELGPASSPAAPWTSAPESGPGSPRSAASLPSHQFSYPPRNFQAPPSQGFNYSPTGNYSPPGSDYSWPQPRDLRRAMDLNSQGAPLNQPRSNYGWTPGSPGSATRDCGPGWTPGSPGTASRDCDPGSARMPYATPYQQQSANAYWQSSNQPVRLWAQVRDAVHRGNR